MGKMNHQNTIRNGKTKARISLNQENTWDLGREWELNFFWKKGMENQGKFFFMGKGKIKANISGICETTGITEKNFYPCYLEFHLGSQKKWECPDLITCQSTTDADVSVLS